MKLRSRIVFSGILLLVFASITFANSAPVVSGVTATQRNDDSKLVDIYYNLADTDSDVCTVWVSISSNGGSTWDVPAMTFRGDIGQGQTPGANKHIIWDAGKDMAGKVATFKARVYADDGKGPAEMVLVPGCWFGYQNALLNNYIYVGTFLIGKFEVTNEMYIQFLNNNDPTSLHWTSSMLINRTGVAGAYSYIVATGKEKYPVYYVSYDDAQAYCTWLSNQTGRTYRLPTEQEWEKAAGWDPTLNKLWTYGFQKDTIDSTWCNYNNYYSGILPVGSFNGTGGKKDATSFYGCYDMSGNLWEWTSSWYTQNSTRVIRGGNWSISAAFCAVTCRGGYPPSTRTDYVVGFRLCLDLN